jgi:hypothetical protein
VNDFEIFRFSCKSPVKVHQVKPLGPGLNPAFRHGDRIFRKNGVIVHSALPKPDAFSTLQINSWYQ